MKATRFLLLSFMFFLLATLSLKSVSADELTPPQKAIDSVSNALHDKMQDKNFIKDFSKVTDFVNTTIMPHTDFDKISALVLGKIWKTATPEQKQGFKKEFQTLLIRTYTRAFVEFKEWSVRFLPIEQDAEATKVMVKTEVLQPGVQPIKVDYRMVSDNGDWKVYDIMIEGVSLVTNYRTTFSNEVQQKGSLDAVIQDLNKRNTEALAAAPQKNS